MLNTKRVSNMMHFLVLVACIAHLKNCPIPAGIKADLMASSRDGCMHMAKSYVIKVSQVYGLNSSNFVITCRSKR